MINPIRILKRTNESPRIKRIRRDMMLNYHKGGIRCKLSWIKKWARTGDGEMSSIRTLLATIFVVQGAISTNYLNLIIFISIYVPCAMYYGVAYFWFDLAGSDTYAGQIIDPFIYQAKKNLGIDDKDGY